MDIVEVSPLDICVEILDFHNGAKLHSECKSMEFCSAKSLYAQIIFIKKIIPTIDIRSICGIMGISTRRYYHAIKSDLRCNNDVVPPNKSLLTEIEEASVLSHNSYKFNALFKKSTTFCICFQLELHFLLAHKKLLTFSIRSQLLLLFLRYIKK